MQSSMVRFLNAVFLITLLCVAFESLQAQSAQGDEQDQIDTQIQRMWQQFLLKLHDNDAQAAAEFFSTRSRKQYFDAFQNAGDQLSNITDGWSEIKAVSLAIPFSEYTLFNHEGDERRMFLISFVKTGDDSWKIDSM